MKTPKYTQRKRTKGYKSPPLTRYCGRGTKYGNYHAVIENEGGTGGYSVLERERWDGNQTLYYFMHFVEKKEANAHAVKLFQKDLDSVIGDAPDCFDELLNYEHLSCWCSPSLPCHVKDAIIPHLERRAKELQA